MTIPLNPPLKKGEDAVRAAFRRLTGCEHL